MSFPGHPSRPRWFSCRVESAVRRATASTAGHCRRAREDARGPALLRGGRMRAFGKGTGVSGLGSRAALSQNQDLLASDTSGGNPSASLPQTREGLHSVSLSPVRRTQGACGHWLLPATFLAGIPAMAVGLSGLEAPSLVAGGSWCPSLGGSPVRLVLVFCRLVAAPFPWSWDEPPLSAPELQGFRKGPSSAEPAVHLQRGSAHSVPFASPGCCERLQGRGLTPFSVIVRDTCSPNRATPCTAVGLCACLSCCRLCTKHVWDAEAPRPARPSPPVPCRWPWVAILSLSPQHSTHPCSVCQLESFTCSSLSPAPLSCP